jgi:DNA-binding response OmpR family regulator
VVLPKRGAGKDTTGGCDVLVVDDDAATVELLLSYFEMKHLDARGLTYSTDYVKDIRAADPRVLLLDVTLPGTNGYHVCAKLKEVNGKKPIKVFMITARPRDEVEANMVASRADGSLLKPFALADLDDLVR